MVRIPASPLSCADAGQNEAILARGGAVHRMARIIWSDFMCRRTV